MKIAIFHELHNGGARRAVNEIAKRLKKNNLVDLYIVDEKDESSERIFFSNVFKYHFNPKEWSGGNWKTRLYKDTVELYQLYRLHRKIAYEIDNKNYDIIFIHPSKYTQAPFILRHLKTMTIYYCEEILRMVYEPKLKLNENLPILKQIYGKGARYIRKVIDKKNIFSTNLILANSLFTQKNIKKAYGLESRVAYLGVETDFFLPTNTKKDIDVLYIGSKDNFDGYDLLRNAIDLTKKKIKVNFHFTGSNWTSDEKLRNLYQRSKIVIALSRDEPFGLIPLEAAACGVPVIALNEGGYKETVIDGKTGLLIDNNAEILVGKIAQLLSNNKLRTKIGSEARKHVVLNWAWDMSVNRIESILVNALNLKTPKVNSNNALKIGILVIIFVFSMSLRMWTIDQIGRTWDEMEFLAPGYKLDQLISKGDFNNNYFISTYNHPPLVKYLYGLAGRFDIEKFTKNRDPVFRYDLTYARILSAIMFSLGVVMVALIGWRIFSPTVGVISGIILSMLPTSIGLSQLVTTESLKILVYPLAIYSYILIVEKFTIRRVILAGILTGIALQAKQTDILLFPLLIVIFYLQYRITKQSVKKVFLKSRVKALTAIILISILTFVVIWPQSIFHLKEIQEINQKTWSVQFSPKPWLITLSPPEIFFGRLTMVPDYYYIVYFLITIPVLILGLFFAGVYKTFKTKTIYYYLVLLWFLVPFSLSIYSWRQHGLRYIIEIYPAIALLAALGFEYITKKLSKGNLIKLSLGFFLAIYLFISIWQIKPYYLDYFNELVGGTGNVYKHNLFQIGWWGQGEREAGYYLKVNAKRGAEVGLALSPEHTFPKFNNLKYSDWSKKNKYDYVVVNWYHIIRDGFDDSPIKRDYRLVYSVKAGEATLAFVYKKK